MKNKCKSIVQSAAGHLSACMEPLMTMIIAGGLTKLVCIFLGLLVESGTTKEIFSIMLPPGRTCPYSLALYHANILHYL